MGGIVGQGANIAGAAGEGFMQGQQMKDEHDRLRQMMAIQAASEGRTQEMFPLHMHGAQTANDQADFNLGGERTAAARAMEPTDQRMPGVISYLNDKGFGMDGMRGRPVDDTKAAYAMQSGAQALGIKDKVAGRPVGSGKAPDYLKDTVTTAQRTVTQIARKYQPKMDPMMLMVDPESFNNIMSSVRMDPADKTAYDQAMDIVTQGSLKMSGRAGIQTPATPQASNPLGSFSDELDKRIDAAIKEGGN